MIAATVYMFYLVCCDVLMPLLEGEREGEDDGGLVIAATLYIL